MRRRRRILGRAPEALPLETLRGCRSWRSHVVSCTQETDEIAGEAGPENIWFHSLYVPKAGWMRTSFQGCIRAVRRKLKQIKPDIVHGQGTERDCAISAVFSRMPNVLTVHGNMRLIAALNKAKPLSFFWLAAHFLEKTILPRTPAGWYASRHYTQDAVKDLARQDMLGGAQRGGRRSFFNVQSRTRRVADHIMRGDDFVLIERTRTRSSGSGWMRWRRRRD